jgi:hypothetical protein
MSTPKLKLYPITGINMYELPSPEMVEQFKHAVNDSEYPEHLYKGAGEEECQDTDLSTSNLSTSLSTSNVDVGVTSPSDIPSTSKVIPIHSRHTNYK